MDNTNAPVTDTPKRNPLSAPAGSSPKSRDELTLYLQWVESEHGRNVARLAVTGRTLEALHLAFREGWDAALGSSENAQAEGRRANDHE